MSDLGSEPGTVRIQPLREQDAERCAEIEREMFAGDDPWSARAFREELAAGHHYFGAYADGELIGYAGLALNGRPPHLEAEIHTIAVTKAFQGTGTGARLLRALLAVADQVHAPVFLEVRTDNTVAIGMYTRAGFAQIGLRRHYYQPSGADAYTMRRDPC